MMVDGVYSRVDIHFVLCKWTVTKAADKITKKQFASFLENWNPSLLNSCSKTMLYLRDKYHIKRKKKKKIFHER